MAKQTKNLVYNYKVALGIKQLLAFIFSFWSHLQIK